MPERDLSPLELAGQTREVAAPLGNGVAVEALKVALDDGARRTEGLVEEIAVAEAYL